MAPRVRGASRSRHDICDRCAMLRPLVSSIGLGGFRSTLGATPSATLGVSPDDMARDMLLRESAGIAGKSRHGREQEAKRPRGQDGTRRKPQETSSSGGLTPDLLQRVDHEDDELRPGVTKGWLTRPPLAARACLRRGSRSPWSYRWLFLVALSPAWTDSGRRRGGDGPGKLLARHAPPPPDRLSNRASFPLTSVPLFDFFVLPAPPDAAAHGQARSGTPGVEAEGGGVGHGATGVPRPGG